jgi:hypothetical protein
MTEACVTRSCTCCVEHTLLVQDVGMAYYTGLEDKLLFGLDVCVVSCIAGQSVLSKYSVCIIVCICAVL